MVRSSNRIFIVDCDDIKAIALIVFSLFSIHLSAFLYKKYIKLIF